jgi:hypothetical protein
VRWQSETATSHSKSVASICNVKHVTSTTMP